MRPHARVITAAAALSRLVAEMTPGTVAYGEEAIHTTITDYMIAPNFVPSGNPEHEHTLEILSSSARRIVERYVIRKTDIPACSYLGYAFNQTGVILRGTPSETFFHITQQMVKMAQQAGISLRMPWGAHATIARFSTISSAAFAQELRSFMAVFNPLQASPYFPFQYVGVGWFANGPKGFNLHMTERIDF